MIDKYAEAHINELKVKGAEIPGETINNAVRLFHQIKLAKEFYEARLKEVQALFDQARHVDVPKKFKEAKTTSITVDGYRFVANELVYASIKKDKKPEGYAWLRDNELGDLIIETVNAATLSAEVRRRLEEGLDVPSEEEDPFNLNLVANVSVTKA